MRTGRVTAELVLLAVMVVVIVRHFRSLLGESAASVRRQDEEPRRTRGAYAAPLPEPRGLLVVPVTLGTLVLTFGVLAPLGATVGSLFQRAARSNRPVAPSRHESAAAEPY